MVRTPPMHTVGGSRLWLRARDRALPESLRIVMYLAFAYGGVADDRRSRANVCEGGFAPAQLCVASWIVLLDPRELDRVDRPPTQDQEQGDARQDAQDCPGHQTAPVRRALRRLRAEDAKCDGQHPHVLVLADQQRPQVLVPGADERQDAQRRQRRAAERHDNTPEYPEE